MWVPLRHLCHDPVISRYYHSSAEVARGKASATVAERVHTTAHVIVAIRALQLLQSHLLDSVHFIRKSLMGLESAKLTWLELLNTVVHLDSPSLVHEHLFAQYHFRYCAKTSPCRDVYIANHTTP